MKTRKTRMLAVMLAAGLSGPTQAALLGRDLNGSIDSFEAYYDTDLNITWLANDANYTMYWYYARDWATNLSIFDAVNNITYDNWRLPISDTCGGYNCTGSEMGHLFYVELGGVAGTPVPNPGMFTSLLGLYWSGSEANAAAWYFDFDTGGQNNVGGNLNLAALAVSDGDVGIAAVPEPETLALMLAGLGLIGLVATRRRL